MCAKRAIRQVLERFGNEKRQRPVEHRGQTARGTTILQREQLTHHQPRNGPETDREERNVQNHRRNGSLAIGVVPFDVLLVKENAL